jgi:tRNA-uridine 2-sulfurtransferase
MVYLNSESARESAEGPVAEPTAGCEDGSFTFPRGTRGATVVAMSGGVDSSVAAALLSREGHDVVGVTLRLWPDGAGNTDAKGPGQRCTAIDEARAVAERLGIPHVVLDCGPAFDRHVAQYFVAAYQRGETPNPCVPCNAWLKFGALLHAIRDWGAAGLATGHYARVEYHEATGRFRLYRAADRRKDQSYVLYALGQDQLAAARFPLGLLAKADTRRLARDFGLPVADKPDSQQACFAAGDYRAYLRERLGAALTPGTMRDVGGTPRGQHAGLPFYTVGQRHGLGLENSRPLYVVELNPMTNEVIVGEDSDLWTRAVDVKALNLIAVDRLSAPMRVRAKIRYAHEPQAATATPLSADRLRLTFDEPQRAVAPGQAAVLYDFADPDVVAGGGTICRPERDTA